MQKNIKIGLALSGGGSRAVAFHLGCLRALNELGILQRVDVLSTVSGGSIIGALYAANENDFSEFERVVKKFLKRGLARPTLLTALFTSEGIKVFMCLILTGFINLVLLIVGWIVWLSTLPIPTEKRNYWHFHHLHSPMRRFASRTTIFRKAIDSELFNGKKLTSLKGDKPFLIINAAELRTGSVFYFSAKESGTWRLGKVEQSNISLAHAVTASAAYPIFLPALDEEITFVKNDGTRVCERVNITDGGVYDNLGLSPLWPDRDPKISLNVHPVDTIICCRAGYGLRHDPPNQFLIGRLKSAFSCIHDRAQNAAMKRLFELKEHGKLKNVVLPYLGQNDKILKYPPSNLISRKKVEAYPTDFSAMNANWIDQLSLRGEQLTKAIIQEHAPELLQI